MSNLEKKAFGEEMRQGDWRRAGVDILQRRIALLDEKERALMRMYLEAGSSYRQLAELSGLNEVTVARRIRSATMRLVSGEYLQCLRHRELLSSMELRVARDFYLAGLPIRAIVLRHGWTLYSVRATINRIRRLAGQSLRPAAGKRKRSARGWLAPTARCRV